MAIAIIAAIIPIIGALVLAGYGIRLAQNIRQGGKGLPEWDDFGGDLTRGFVTIVGTFLQAMIWFIPLFIVLGIILSIGQTSYYSEVELQTVYEPNPFSLLISLVIGLVTAFFFLIFNASAIANYLDNEKFSVFFEFGKLIKECTTNLKRNFSFAVNLFVFQIVISILSLIGFYLCFLPSLLASALGTIGYYYIIADWAKKINGPAIESFDMPDKPKRGHEDVDW